ncbi:MAG: DUF6065 family protein [Gemmatimonadota bacterium]
MKLECYVEDNYRYDIRPANHRRDWMDETTEAFAYRCLPLSIANAHGWEIRCLQSFEAEWNGGLAPADVVVQKKGDAPLDVKGHFGHGILTFGQHFVIRTPPGYGLWVTGPPNHFKDGIQALSAAIETDWMPFSFTMNWKFTRPNHRVTFSIGEPYCFFFPVRIGDVEEFVPEFRNLSNDTDLVKQYRYALGRRGFSKIIPKAKKEGQIRSPMSETDVRSIKFQGWYSKGELPDGTPWPDHRRKVRVQPFKGGESIPPDDQD